MSKKSVIDTSKPNPGRIYDYALGGTHNFEIDRQVAEQMLTLIPFMRKNVHLQRGCLRDIAKELTQNRRYDIIIDFASGLPTVDHIHHIAPEGTTVIYSDLDPGTVKYAKEIVQDIPNVHVFSGDAGYPETLLEHPEMQDILGGRRDVAMILWGVSAALSDERLSHTSRYLYDWAGQDSCLVFQAQGADFNKNHPSMIKIQEVYKKMGLDIYYRSLKEYQTLIHPWQPDKNGFISLLEWHGVDESEMTEEDRKAVGSSGIGYGAYLIK